MDGSRIGLSTALWRSFRNGDFEEEDVWNVLNDKSTTTTSKTTDHSNFSTDSSIIESAFLPSASRMIPRPNGSGGGGGGYVQIVPRSAPRSIPQWFKREGSKNPRKLGSEQDDEDGSGGDGGDSEEEEEEEEEGEEGFENRVPPHELIAKRLARAQISSFSVFEGVGRTLKGRDLSKVRNAVLNKTGFLESL